MPAGKQYKRPRVTCSRYDVMVKQDATFDTSFWVNAYRSGLLPYVLDRFALQYVPDVGGELKRTNPSGRAFRRRVRAGEVLEARPTASHLSGFGRGERAAIDLVLEQPGLVLLIDDYRPHEVAISMGVRVISTPELVAQLLDEQVLDRDGALRILTQLTAIQTVSPRLIARGRAQIERWLGEERK